MECPYRDECISQIYSRPKMKESMEKMNEEFPPPPPPLCDGNWELQFCKWWGWTWVKKENRADMPERTVPAVSSHKSVSIAPTEAEKQKPEPPPPPAKKTGCFCCRKKKKPPPAAPKSTEKREVGFTTSTASVKKSEPAEEPECCMCCPCMQQQFMGCPCMQQQSSICPCMQQQFYQPQQNVQEIPLASKQVQCSQHCNSVDTQTQHKLQQIGCPCVLQRQRQQMQCCPCPQNRRQATNADTQTAKKVQNQSTAISHANLNLSKAKKYRDCKCIRKFIRPTCCPCNNRQINSCCPCYNITDCPKNQNYPETTTANWCLTETQFPKITGYQDLKQSPTIIDKSIDLLIKNNMNIKNLLDAEKYFRTETTRENFLDSNETISFLSNNAIGKDHCKLLTKVCDAILSSNTFNEQNKSSSSSTAHLPTILSDKSLYESILKDTKNQYLHKLMERSEKDVNLRNFNSLLLNNEKTEQKDTDKVHTPIRPNISRISFTNPNLARAETIEELITAMDLSFNNNVLENFETTTLNK